MKIEYDEPMVECALLAVKKRFEQFEEISMRVCDFISRACDRESFEADESDLSEALFIIRSIRGYASVINNLEYDPDDL